MKQHKKKGLKKLEESEMIGTQIGKRGGGKNIYLRRVRNWRK